MLALLSALASVLPIFAQLISLFVKTPEEKRNDLVKSLLLHVKACSDAVDKAEKNGDTTDLEDIIHRL